jgi:hypothetical protein
MADLTFLLHSTPTATSCYIPTANATTSNHNCTITSACDATASATLQQGLGRVSVHNWQRHVSISAAKASSSTRHSRCLRNVLRNSAASYSSPLCFHLACLKVFMYWLLLLLRHLLWWALHSVCCRGSAAQYLSQSALLILCIGVAVVGGLIETASLSLTCCFCLL